MSTSVMNDQVLALFKRLVLGEKCRSWASFHPERVLFRLGGVNLRACLCGVPRVREYQIMYASAQPLDFLARTKIFRLKAVSGMTRLSLLFEQKPRGAWNLSRSFRMNARL